MGRKALSCQIGVFIARNDRAFGLEQNTGWRPALVDRVYHVEHQKGRNVPPASILTICILSFLDPFST